ncbi:MAG: hypothetical protein ACRDMV_17005 [Streptosporangiales bacterium]
MPGEQAPPSNAEPPSPATRPSRLRTSVVIPARFRGPRDSANGGYVAARVASYVGVTSVDATAPHGVEPRPVTAVLRSPVSLDVPLELAVDGDRVTLHEGGALVAEAEPGELDTDPLEPVTYADALAAGERFAGVSDHPMPTCFGCGTERAPGDGLRLAIGAVSGDLVATAWVPDRSLLPPGAQEGPIAPEFVWSVLDCTAAWAWDFGAEPALLGTMTGVVDEAPYVGDHCAAVATVTGRDGRKIRTATCLYDADGRVLGRAQSVWITVDRSRL